MDVVEIGRQIAALRKAKGWSQSRLAKSTGVSRAFVSNLERGLGDPGLRKVLFILDLLDHTLSVTVADGPPTLDQLLEERQRADRTRG